MAKTSRIDPKAVDNLIRKFDDLPDEVKKRVNKQLFKGGQAIYGDIIESILGPAKGKTQKRYSPTREVTVSKPGDPPHNDIGDLARGIKEPVLVNDEVRVVSTAPHGPDLEYGTSKMVERPFMRPAFNKNIKKIVAGVRRVIGKYYRTLQETDGGN